MCTAVFPFVCLFFVCINIFIIICLCVCVGGFGYMIVFFEFNSEFVVIFVEISLFARV